MLQRDSFSSEAGSFETRLGMAVLYLGWHRSTQLHIQDVYINISLLFSDIQIITVLVSWILLLVSRFAQ